MQKKQTLITIMAKQPKVGSTKTRLCPPLSLKEAAEIYEAMLLDTIELVLCVNNVDKGIAITPSEALPYFREIAPKSMRLIAVDCSDIGDCLEKVINGCLDEGYKNVIALNSDGPNVPIEYIYKAIGLLDNHDLVIGPNIDGGYYLIGMKEHDNSIFRKIEWSTSKVLTQTLSRALRQNKSIALLPSWFDVDTAADLERLRSDLVDAPDHILVHTKRSLLKIK